MFLEFEKYGKLEWLACHVVDGWETIDFIKCVANKLFYEIVQNVQTSEIKFITAPDYEFERKYKIYKKKGINI